MRQFDLDTAVEEAYEEILSELQEMSSDIYEAIVVPNDEALWQLAQDRVDSRMDDYWDAKYEEQRDARFGL